MRSILRSNEVNLRTKLSKQRTELSKTVYKVVKTQSNGRVNLKYGIYRPGTHKLGCVLIPLGSPTRSSKQLFSTVYCTVSLVRGRVYRAGYGTGVGILGGYTGWVLPLHRGRTPARSHVQRSGPRKALQGLEWVVRGAAPSVRLLGPPFGPGRYPCRVPPCPRTLLEQTPPLGQ